MNAYLASVIENVRKKHANEPEFVQTVEEVFSSLEPVIEKHPEYEKVDLLGRMVEPERMFTFRVVWMADDGTWHTNIGYRCQFNGAIGPYKGGLRFQPNVYPGIIKFLGFEQIFKNSLTGLPIGGGKGGADFDPTGKSDAEIMRFCQSFMQALYRYIGPDVDVPAGDMGVGAREIGYLYGEYRRLKGAFENGVLTGKGFSYGGSRIRPEATGFGAVYYLQNVLEHEGEKIEGKTIACAGFGNVTWGICQLGAKVVTLSGPDGYIYDPDGVATDEKINYIVEMRASGRNKVKDYADKFGVEFHPGEKPWGVKVDICMPSAMQNDVHMHAHHQRRSEVPDGAARDDRGALQGRQRRRRGYLRPGDGPEQRAPGVDGGGSRQAAPPDHEHHLSDERGRGGAVWTGVQPGGRRQHRRLPAGGRRHDGPGRVLSGSGFAGNHAAVGEPA